MRYLWFEKGAYASKKARHYINNQFQPSEIKNIAVIRHAALGDQVITRPFLIEARKFFPNATITLVGVSNYQYGMPSDLADNTIVVAGRENSKKMSLFEKLADFRQLEEQDIVFDLAGTNRSYWMTALTKAKLKVGFPYRRYLCGTLYNLAVFRSDFQPEVECMLDMLKVFGHFPSYPLQFGLPDNRELYDYNSPYILYFNGASQRRKLLPKETMLQLMKLGVEELPQYTHIFLEGKCDHEKGEFLQELVNDNKVKVQPCLPLNELTEYIAKAKLVVSPDTSIRNIAIATHTPTVGFFYSKVPFRYTPLYEKHYVTMNADGKMPTSHQVLQSILQALSDTACPLEQANKRALNE